MRTLLALLLMVLLTETGYARPQLRIITLQHRFAEEMLATVRPLAGEGGTVSAFSNQLIVNAEPEALVTIETVVRQMDVERRNWRITIGNTGSGSGSDTQSGVSGEIGRDVRVAVPDSRSETRRGVNIELSERSRSWTQSGSMELQTLDGEPAYLRVGQEIPYTVTWVDLTKRHARLVQDVEWRDVSTGFIVRPRQIGDRVDLEIVPRLSSATGGGVIDFTELATHIQARPGEWVDLGSLLSTRDEVSRAILQNGDSSRKRGMQLRIKAE